MFAPWYRIVPSTRQSGTRSFIRLKHRSRVDLPQPDGPIRAVTSLARIGMVTCLSAWTGPYQRSSPCVSMIISFAGVFGCII